MLSIVGAEMRECAMSGISLRLLSGKHIVSINILFVATYEAKTRNSRFWKMLEVPAFKAPTGGD
jgi:hypothetical protein